ncbi:MAG: hypothetical protein JNM24_14525 [Bdellovibrionaceae bacterium]|nr:hypothetical protein [Pseudobdellovibrionaceae bacterium]
MSNFRKKYLIEPHFQVRFLNFITLGIVLNLFLYVVSNLFVFYRLTTFAEGAKGMITDDTLTLIENLSRDQLVVLLLSSLLITGFSYGVGLIMTHRAAGPLFRINKHLDEYNTTKKFTKISLREKDFFKETADKINLAFENRE